MNKPISPDILLDCAIRAARITGNHALKNYSRRHEILKTLNHDIKLKLDVECQKKAIETISRQFPDHSFLGEEDASFSARKNKSDYEWIIDPIDGTINFSHGIAMWSCSIAVRSKGKILAGAVYAPMLNELFTASVRRNAECNGKRLHVSTEKSLIKSIVLTGVDRRMEKKSKPFYYFERIAEKTRRVRVLGSAAYDLCQVASGNAEGYFEADIYIWDIAAAGLIVQQAGGKTEILRKTDSNQNLSFMATNGKIHKELRSIVCPT